MKTEILERTVVHPEGEHASRSYTTLGAFATKELAKTFAFAVQRTHPGAFAMTIGPDCRFLRRWKTWKQRMALRAAATLAA